MARAKRTDRAEARRRNRATFADPLGAGDAPSDGADVTADPTPDRAAAVGQRGRAPGPGPARPGASAPQRPSVMAAFTSSFRPVDFRTDIRQLPRLLMHRAFLAPAVASGLAFIVAVYAPSEAPAVIFYQYFSGQVPVAALFIAGFFAPRASYLIGALLALASVLFQFPLWIGQSSEYILGALVSAVISGALFASMAAWYRRFLSRANPNRARPTTPTSRRPDGKVPKKPQQRPMLARRR